MIRAVKAVEHLHVLVPHQQVFSERAGYLLQERPTVVGVDLRGGGRFASSIFMVISRYALTFILGSSNLFCSLLSWNL